ncbi:MAG: glycosyltransferase family 2 protein [Azoarcus sp. PHD]|nr:MAG: glycosyltransferase family 2 protein [Azoarcus sp. PHD]
MNITVIIPTFNRAAFIAESIESILNQTHPPSQVIVSDDGSTDDTATVVCQFGNAVTYIRQDNGGKSSAVNNALAHASGDFVWIFDDDDVAYPEALAQHLALHERDPELGFTFGFHDYGVSGKDGRIEKTSSPQAPLIFSSSISNQRLNLLKYCAFMLSACVVRRSALEAAGPFREDLHRSQDYEMLIRLSQLFNFVYTGSPTYIMRKHDGVRGPAVDQHKNTDRRRVWRKYDHMIGLSIAENIPLERYQEEAVPPDSLPTARRRTALIRRAWVMASKANIEQLVSDLVAASRECASPTKLTAVERECCHGLCDHPYFLMCLFDDPNCLRPLLSLRESTAGMEMLRSISKGLYWTAIDKEKELSLRDRARMLRAAVPLLISGTQWRLKHE